jgi:rhomboid protease GluP
MAFGSPPRHIQQKELSDLPGDHFLALALDAVDQLDWNIGYKSETGFIAFTKTSITAFCEEIRVLISDSTIRLESECTGSQLNDWGKNKENIERLLEKVEELKEQTPPEAIARRHSELKPGLVPAEDCVLNRSSPGLLQKLTNSLDSLLRP